MFGFGDETSLASSSFSRSTHMFFKSPKIFFLMFSFIVLLKCEIEQSGSHNSRLNGYISLRIAAQKTNVSLPKDML